MVALPLSTSMRCFCRGTPSQNFLVRLFLMGKSLARENMVMELANHGSTNRLAMSVRIWSHYRDVLEPLAPTKSSCSCLQRVFTSLFPSNSSDSSPFNFHTLIEVFSNQKSVMRIILLNEEKHRLRFTPCLKNILDLLAILAFTLVCLRLRERYACIAAVFVPIPGGEIEQACEQAGERTRAPGVSKKKKEKKS